MQSIRIPVGGEKTDPLYSHLSKAEPRQETVEPLQGCREKIGLFCVFVLSFAAQTLLTQRLDCSGSESDRWRRCQVSFLQLLGLFVFSEEHSDLMQPPNTRDEAQSATRTKEKQQRQRGGTELVTTHLLQLKQENVFF